MNINDDNKELELAIDSVSKNNLLDIIKNTPTGICITDEKGIFKYVNPAYCDIYGYKEDELIGNHFTIVVPEEIKKMMIQMHDSFILDQDVEVRGEWEVIYILLLKQDNNLYLEKSVFFV